MATNIIYYRSISSDNLISFHLPPYPVFLWPPRSDIWNDGRWMGAKWVPRPGKKWSLVQTDPIIFDMLDSGSEGMHSSPNVPDHDDTCFCWNMTFRLVDTIGASRSTQRFSMVISRSIVAMHVPSSTERMRCLSNQNSSAEDHAGVLNLTVCHVLSTHPLRPPRPCQARAPVRGLKLRPWCMIWHNSSVHPLTFAGACNGQMRQGRSAINAVNRWWKEPACWTYTRFAQQNCLNSTVNSKGSTYRLRALWVYLKWRVEECVHM